MAAGNTYVAIRTESLQSPQASVIFSDIPGSYTDLVLVCSAKSTTAGPYSVTVRFNSDSASNYSDTRIIGNGSAASSNRDSSQTEMYPVNITNTFGAVTHHIMNYANTTTYKMILSRGVSADYQVWANVGLWRKTEAINTILLSGSTFDAGSTFTLYGIAAA